MARDLASCSGRWVGWWVQGIVKGHQSMTLRIANGEISGEGADSSGSFTVTGEYDGEDVQLIKGYRFWNVRYFGRWDGAMISGRWTILDREFFDAGVFELWPEDESTELQFERREATATA